MRETFRWRGLEANGPRLSDADDDLNDASVERAQRSLKKTEEVRAQVYAASMHEAGCNIFLLPAIVINCADTKLCWPCTFPGSYNASIRP